MQGTLTAAPAEAARDELEAVAGSLIRTPRLEQLLRYLAARHFAGETDQLTEYNIATDVFGRKKTEFIASEDAIARVETHRLRKKLTAFYEGPGRDHAVQISIPLGTYVPHFAERTPSSDVPVRVAARQTLTEEPGFEPEVLAPPTLPDTAFGAEGGDQEVAAETLASAPPHGTSPLSDLAGAEPRRWPWVLAFALVVVLIFGGGLLHLLRAPTSPTAAATHSNAETANVPAVPTARVGGHLPPGVAPVSVPFRMIAGYSGAPQRDNAGDVWQADRFSQGGWPWHESRGFIARTGNPFLFRYGRQGEQSYAIPLGPGSYELHLYFMQGSDAEQSEDAENKEIFSVEINRVLMLKNFDIVSDALGRNVADERVFRDVSPDADGMLHIRLSTVVGTPSLSAIEILPDASHRLLPLRLVMQPTTYTDRSGQLWRPDDYFLSGRLLSHNLPETVNENDTLPFERYGHFQYALPVDPRDRYTLKLRFVELYFGTQGADIHEDRRLFRVLCNGQTLLDDFDIKQEAGSYHVLEKTFHQLKPTAQGKLNLDFEPITNYATLSSIEVVDETK